MSDQGVAPGQKSFPALVTVCTCESHLESRLNSSILWFRLEPRSNSKIRGNDRTHSLTLPPHFLCPDDPYSFLSLLSSAVGLSQGGCLHRAVWARCLCLSYHYTTLCKTQPCTSPHALHSHFSCLTPPSCLSFFSISKGAQKYLLNNCNCLCIWAGTYCFRIPPLHAVSAHHFPYILSSSLVYILIYLLPSLKYSNFY